MEDADREMEDEDRELVSQVLKDDTAIHFIFGDLLDSFGLSAAEKRELLDWITEKYPEKAKQSVRNLIRDERRRRMLNYLCEGMKVARESEPES